MRHTSGSHAARPSTRSPSGVNRAGPDAIARASLGSPLVPSGAASCSRHAVTRRARNSDSVTLACVACLTNHRYVMFNAHLADPVPG